MVAIKARFDGRALIPEDPVELPRDRLLIIHVETHAGPLSDEPLPGPVFVPSDPEAARRLVCDVESAMENL
jgi:hypothetical protein